MWNKPLLTLTSTQQRYFRIALGIFLAFLTLLAFGAYLVLQTKITAYQAVYQNKPVGELIAPETIPFPISVNPLEQRIVYNEENEAIIQDFVTPYLSTRRQDRWFDQLLARLGTQTWFQTLATPSSRILIILPGERQEQIAYNIGRILNWNATERDQFISNVVSSQPSFPEGTFFPGRYIVPHDATPEFVANMINNRFERSVLDRYPTVLEETVPMIEALTLASLLERESYHFSEMRIIAGVIWNRLFQDMNLQIDATLQYAKANAGLAGGSWWPQPLPDDKFIDSPFNTYQNSGLPPSPIANPGVASIIAALNPVPTDCVFYFHDRRGGFHCSETYEQHVQGLRIHYGQGR